MQRARADPAVQYDNLPIDLPIDPRVDQSTASRVGPEASDYVTSVNGGRARLFGPKASECVTSVNGGSLSLEHA